MSSKQIMTIEMKKKVYTATKTIAFAFCLAGFVSNSFMIFKQFIGKKTITSQDIKHDNKLAVPSFTLCSLSGYKEKIIDYHGLTLKNYHNNTLELDETLISINGMAIKDRRHNSKLWDVKTTYSAFKGRCHTIGYKFKVLR